MVSVYVSNEGYPIARLLVPIRKSDTTTVTWLIMCDENLSLESTFNNAVIAD